MEVLCKSKNWVINGLFVVKLENLAGEREVVGYNLCFWSTTGNDAMIAFWCHHDVTSCWSTIWWRDIIRGKEHHFALVTQKSKGFNLLYRNYCNYCNLKKGPCFFFFETIAIIAIWKKVHVFFLRHPVYIYQISGLHKASDYKLQTCFFYFDKNTKQDQQNTKNNKTKGLNPLS